MERKFYMCCGNCVHCILVGEECECNINGCIIENPLIELCLTYFKVLEE